MSWEVKRLGSVSVDVPVAEVVGKQRPRHARGRGKPYTPSKTKRAEDEIRRRFKEASGGRWRLFGGPVSVCISYSRELAKTNPKFWAGRTDLMKPDADNVAKLVLDAINGTAFVDDSQVRLAIRRQALQGAARRREPHKHPRRLLRGDIRKGMNMKRYFKENKYTDYSLEELHYEIVMESGNVLSNLFFQAVEDESAEEKHKLILANSALALIALCEAVLSRVPDDLVDESRDFIGANVRGRIGFEDVARLLKKMSE